jgi:signal transduction histidine kinase
LVTVALTVTAVEGRSEYVLDAMVALATYMVATRFDRRVTVPALVLVVLALGAGSIAGGATASDQASAMHNVLFAVSGWCVGESVRWRRAYVTGLREHAAERARVDAERVRAAVREQRVRIARELHDVVAHSLGVITVQAGVGRRVFGDRPDQARDALAAVEVIGRSASDELRRIVGLLREDDVEPPLLAPAPGLDDLPDLVDRVRGAGVPVQLSVLGAPRGVPAAVGLSAYRIVQEALTNVVRHAPGASATVTVESGRDGVRISVLNDGAGRKLSGNGAGHGIIGMRERVAAFGGELSAQPRPEGGFEVAAFLPAGGD